MVLGVIVSNIMLLKYSAKFPMTKNINQDPIEQAIKRKQQREQQEKNSSEDETLD